MKKRKIIKTIFAAAIAMLGVYFFSSFSYQYIGGLYYSQLYKKRLAEKTKTKPVTYYISAEGNDTNNGLSQSSAWQSFLNINNIDLNPGDSILLKGGDTITGNLNLTGNDLGTKEKPLVISSFGGGNASIYTVAGDAIRAVNSQGISISNLIINGCGPAKNNNSGIAIINDLPGDIKLPFIRINNVDASGFGFCGILMDGNNGKSGFTDVVISNSSFHDNGEAGLYVYGKFTTNEGEYAHEKVHIRYVKAYNNAGKPGKDIQNSGSGIVLSDVNSGLIEYCTTYNNGWQCESLQGGPVGIWAWDSNNIIIQHNESYQNKRMAVSMEEGSTSMEECVTPSSNTIILMIMTGRVSCWRNFHMQENTSAMLFAIISVKTTAGKIVMVPYMYGAMWRMPSSIIIPFLMQHPPRPKLMD